MTTPNDAPARVPVKVLNAQQLEAAKARLRKKFSR